MKIYVASSWRNAQQPSVVAALRADHEVYDFRHPAPDNDGFAWSAIDREWLRWTPDTFRDRLLSHGTAAKGFALDKDALDWADACVLVLPCGRSAHLEAGYAIGRGKPTIILLHPDKFEPELMYLLASRICVSLDEVIAECFAVETALRIR